MRYVLIGLGALTVALAVILGWEQLWWAALPDGVFGIGITWVAWASLRDEKMDRLAASAPPFPAPKAEAEAKPAAADRPGVPVSEPARPPLSQPPPAPAPAPPPSPPIRPRPSPRPKRSGRRRK